MWSNMSSRYGHIAFRVLLRLDPAVLGPVLARLLFNYSVVGSEELLLHSCVTKTVFKILIY